MKCDYNDDQIASCLEFLEHKGIPGNGGACHSPMGFLSVAMTQILPLATEGLARRKRVEEQTVFSSLARERRQAEEEVARQETVRREEAFVAAFPETRMQEEIIAKFSDSFSAFASGGSALRSFAIGAWWSHMRAGNTTGPLAAQG